jgi:hypothetical protein
MPEEIWGMSFWSFLSIVIVGGLIILMTTLYGILWWMARNYRNKHNLHGDVKDYKDVVKGNDANGKA